MPFTLAHPAAIIPLQKLFKNKLSLTGLIIGSIIPDFEYLVNIVERSVISHKLEGVLYFDIPAALIITFCWHGFVKQFWCLSCHCVYKEFLLLMQTQTGFCIWKKTFTFIFSHCLLGFFCICFGMHFLMLMDILWLTIRFGIAVFFLNRLQFSVAHGGLVPLLVFILFGSML